MSSHINAFQSKNVLDQALYPKPPDVFASAQRRTEIYGLDEEDDEENSDMQDNPNSVIRFAAIQIGRAHV